MSYMMDIKQPMSIPVASTGTKIVAGLGLGFGAASFLGMNSNNGNCNGNGHGRGNCNGGFLSGLFGNNNNCCDDDREERLEAIINAQANDIILYKATAIADAKVNGLEECFERSLYSVNNRIAKLECFKVVDETTEKLSAYYNAQIVKLKEEIADQKNRWNVKYTPFHPCLDDDYCHHDAVPPRP